MRIAATISFDPAKRALSLSPFYPGTPDNPQTLLNPKSTLPRLRPLSVIAQVFHKIIDMHFLPPRFAPVALSAALFSIAPPVLAQSPVIYPVTVDMTNALGEVDGFGASSAWYEDEFWEMPAANRAAFIDQFFDPGEGLGLTIYRVRIDPQMGAEPDEEPFFDWTHSRRQAFGQFVREVQDRHDPFIMASIWSPPAYMKDNGSKVDGGSLLPEYYDEYARFLSLWVQGMQSQFGVTIDALSFQNEPGKKSWESCQWTNAQIKTFFKDHFLPTLIADGLIPALGEPEGGLKLIVNEATSWTDAGINAILADPDIAPYIDIAAAHVYGDGGFPVRPFTTARSMGKRVWQTEFYARKTYGTTSNSIGYGLLVTRFIHNMFVTNEINAYNFWWMASPEDKDIQALVDMTEDNTNFGLMKQGAAFGQFSRFVRPGDWRVGVSNPFPEHKPEVPLSEEVLVALRVGVVAFKSAPGDRMVFVAINDGDQPCQIDLDIHAPGGVITSLRPWRTSASEDIASLDTVPVSGNAAVLDLPSDSVTTYVATWVPTSFASWAGMYELPTDGTGPGAPDATPAQDSIPNTIKYLFGLNPWIRGYQGRLATTIIPDDETPDSPRYLTLKATIADPQPPDLQCHILGSSDLVTWPDTLPEVGRTSTGDGTQTVIWQDTTSTESSHSRFLRMAVEPIP